MDLWVTPEVERRQAAGAIPKPFNLHAAQVIFYADARPHEIRLNEEVRAIGKVKLKQGVSKQKGAPIYSNEIEDYEAFRLPDDEDPNCGHITLHRFADQWSLAFDLIYNKGISSEHLAAAEEFLKSAEAALEQGHYRVVVDNLFSASELAAKALLLTTPLPGKGTKMGRGMAVFIRASTSKPDLAMSAPDTETPSTSYPICGLLLVISINPSPYQRTR
jgi:hypothetical protein